MHNRQFGSHWPKVVQKSSRREVSDSSVCIEQRIKYMNSSEGSSISGKGGHNLLSKAGQLTLSNNPHSLLQEVGDDQDFAPVGNITTTYLDQKVNTSFSPPAQLPVKSNYTTRISPPKTSNDFQYTRITAQLRSNTKAQLKATEKKKQEKLKMFMEGEQSELADVENLIGEIQSLVSSNPKTTQQISFKPKVEKSKRANKMNWQTKGIQHFPLKNSAFSKLEELLLNYKIQEKITEPLEPTNQHKSQISAGRVSDRRRRHQERTLRNKKYQQVQKDLQQAYNIDRNVQKNEPIQEIKKPDPIQQHSEPKDPEELAEDIPGQSYQQNFQQKEEQEQDKQLLKLQDIELVQIEWNKLPIILSSFTPQNSQLFMRIRDYPDDQTFVQAITQTLPQEQNYNNYSIFDPKRTAGMKNKTLQSQQEFRQTWAEEWQHQIDEQETKQLLCQLDFQWYRSLVQLTYSHSLEEILMKNLNYDPELFLANVKKINGGQNDKNKIVDNLTLSFRIILNKLKFIELLLGKFHKEHGKNKNKKNVIVGVVPSISQQMNADQKSMLKQWVQTMFIGGLYSAQGQSSMAVMVPLDQAQTSKVERLSPGQVKIGSSVLLINTTQTKIKGSKIFLRPQRLKNSMIRIAIQRPNDEQNVLQVGEQLHCGRRYSIDLD